MGTPSDAHPGPRPPARGRRRRWRRCCASSRRPITSTRESGRHARSATPQQGGLDCAGGGRRTRWGRRSSPCPRACPNSRGAAPSAAPWPLCRLPPRLGFSYLCREARWVAYVTLLSMAARRRVTPRVSPAFPCTNAGQRGVRYSLPRLPDQTARVGLLAPFMLLLRIRKPNRATALALAGRRSGPALARAGGWLARWRPPSGRCAVGVGPRGHKHGHTRHFGRRQAQLSSVNVNC